MTRHDEPRQPSSAPCSMEEFGAELLPTPKRLTGPDWDAVRRLRKKRRAALIAARTSRPLRERQRDAERVRERLRHDIELARYAVLGLYWPIRGEIDVRDIAAEHIARGGVAALPVVVTKNAPVQFWRWQPDAPMRIGFWNIPVPVEPIAVVPDALLIPLVGFDAAGYRLGYGGGYYDRTLAALEPPPVRIGVGYADAEITTIYPQPHDVPLNAVVTEKRVRYFARPRSAAH